MRSSIAGFALIAATMLGTTACARNPSMRDDGNTTTSAGSSTESESESSTETSTMGDGDGDTSDDSSNPSLSFYACAPDDDYFSISECDPFSQDCPEGEKCVPYASAGGEFDANKCVPITGDQQSGEACTYAGVEEATDDCDQDSYCFYVEAVDDMFAGTCTAFCEGTPDDPLCEPATGCLISNEGSVTLCLASCHPITQGCIAGQACEYDGNAEFLCQPEAANGGATGDPCGLGNACAGGNVCLDAASVPNCQGDSCCTEYCDLDDPNFVCGDPQSECAPFFEELQMVPPELHNVGVCLAPLP